MKPAFLIFFFAGILFLLEISTGAYLFLEKYGFSVDKATEYITGNPEKFIPKKSIHGLLEIHFPHFFAVFISIFVILHFFYFFKIRAIYFFLSFFLFIFGFLNIISPFLILYNAGFSILKIISFSVFFFLFTFTVIILIILTVNRLIEKCQI
ncbi:hypothetical protein SAMN06265182_0660 [Persephonella hydrogeniphila]|uniref:DUF4306 domain-containing protein n=1 Tax=Persephonella hydrogeniphila TaxID=198703 RepID=A0A285NAC7_9AQUI|nr:hypothetical protein [Persephonella hydrogeniphila]SNZ06390.1 hypothetical protein SAMN06265182_0660 [Persephonella hydrogeniphila]